ncbi:MAG TPA: restriction endonuclease [Candidatus Paceibacterota bacterium]
MLNNVSNSKISNEQLSKFSTLVGVINGVENNIPLSTKSVFNFKGRKSEAIAKLVIEHLTDETSIVCDPFAGTGTFPIASSLIPRKSIGIELDNYTYSIVKTLLADIDFSKLDDMFKKVKNEVFDDIMGLYETNCCGEKNFIKTLYFDPEPKEYYTPRSHREIKNGENIKLYYKCPICGKKSKQFNITDENKRISCNKLDTSLFPSYQLIENSRINITSSTGAGSYDMNFTNRNKFALLKLQQCILKFDPSIERDVLEHALVSSLTLSRIAQYGSGSEYIYQVMRFQAQEMNVWYLFESKYHNILNYKHEYFSSKNVSSPTGESFLTLLEGDYYKILSDRNYNEKFNLIYTDPPYTDQVPYLERNQLYRGWLYNFYNRSNFNLTKDMLESEVVVSNAPTRSTSKDIINYYEDLNKMFETFYRCTKSNGIVALTLNLGKNKYFNILSEVITKARKNGFEYVSRIDLTKKDRSFRKQAASKNTLSTEMLVFFVKLDSNQAYWYINDRNIELEIGALIYNLILKNKGITLTTAIKTINTDILKTNSSGTDITNTRIKKLIKEQFVIEEKTSNVYIDSNKLYFNMEDNTSLFYKLYDMVPIIINNLLETKGSFTLDDLYFDISNKLCNGDPFILNQLLEDPLHEHYIVDLIKNYCDTKQDTYIKKPVNIIYNDDAIDISILDGYQFEELLRQLLEAEGYKNVYKVGGAGDRGVDLRAKKVNPLNGQVEGYIIQAKRWISNVGGTPIQRLHSMWMQYPNEIQHAICITTSDYTPDGGREAVSTGVKTVNGNQLMDRLNLCFPNKYYHSLLNFSI